MRKVLSLAIAIAVTIAGCGGSSTPSSTPATTAAVAAPGSVQLALAEMKLIVNNNVTVVIHADGTIRGGAGAKAAKVTPDGKMISLATGEVVLALQPDGTIKDVQNNQVLDVTLTDEGAITVRDRTYSLDAAGELVGGDPAAPKMRVEGATDASLRRTAMFVLALSFAQTSTPASSVADRVTEPATATSIAKLRIVIEIPGKVDVFDTDVTGKEKLADNEVRIETSNEHVGTMNLRFRPAYETANDAKGIVKIATSDATNIVVTKLPERAWILTWQYNNNKWYGVKVFKKIKGKWLLMEARPESREALELALAAFKSVRPA